MAQTGLVGLLLVVVVVTTMLALGMSLGLREMLASFRRLGLLMRSVIAAFGLSVAWTWIVVHALGLLPASAGALLLLMCLPPAATAARFSAIAGADQAYALAVLVFLSAVAIVATPLLLEVVLPVPGPVTLDRPRIVLTLLLLVMAPAAAGILLRSLAPARAGRLKGPVVAISNVALAAVLVAVTWVHHDAMFKLGGAVLAAIVLVCAGSMAAGWALTGPAKATRFAGATACSGRHAGIALLIVAMNFPVSRIGDENMARVIATLVAYAVFELSAGFALAIYHGRRMPANTDGAVL